MDKKDIAPTEGAPIVHLTVYADYEQVVLVRKRACEYEPGTRITPYANAAPSPKAPAPSVEQPLSDEQIKDMARACGLYGVQDAVVSCVRALLQSAHTADQSASGDTK